MSDFSDGYHHVQRIKNIFSKTTVFSIEKSHYVRLILTSNLNFIFKFKGNLHKMESVCMNHFIENF